MPGQRTITFWIYLAIFQVAFGAAIFLATRHYYVGDTQPTPSSTAQVPIETTANGFTPEMLDTLTTFQRETNDPAEISRIADQLFADQQYARAAEWYEKLRQIDPGNARTLNNLGLTLHYLGRSEEALAHLNYGVASDPANQRIRLTLGFVNSATGHVEAARAALTAAVEMNPTNNIGHTAAEMLAQLP